MGNSLQRDLKDQLARELKAIMSGWSQIGAAGMLGVRQQHVSRIWRGELAGYSVWRLLRLIATRHYHIELHLKPVLKPYALPRQRPTVRVIRFDRYGRVATG